MPHRYLQRTRIFPLGRNPAVRAAEPGRLNAGLLIDIVGWAGAALILGAYALLTAGRVDSRSVLYQGMNVIGALGFIANGWWHGATPSAVLNVIWAGIGLVALWKIRSQRPASPE